MIYRLFQRLSLELLKKVGILLFDHVWKDEIPKYWCEQILHKNHSKKVLIFYRLILSPDLIRERNSFNKTQWKNSTKESDICSSHNEGSVLLIRVLVFLFTIYGKWPHFWKKSVLNVVTFKFLRLSNINEKRLPYWPVILLQVLNLLYLELQVSNVTDSFDIPNRRLWKHKISTCSADWFDWTL